VKRGQRTPDRRGGTTKVPEDAEQDRRALLWSLPLVIVFFTIVVVIVVTVGKVGHSLGAMECAPSLWLPWMAWRKRGECAIMVVGYVVYDGENVRSVHHLTSQIRKATHLRVCRSQKRYNFF
jgi:hypothetical protein